MHKLEGLRQKLLYFKSFFEYSENRGIFATIFQYNIEQYLKKIFWFGPIFPFFGQNHSFRKIFGFMVQKINYTGTNRLDQLNTFLI